MPLTGRVALVTGAARGIGLATARRLAGDGARVVVSDRHGSAELERVAEEIGGLALAADITDRGAVAELVRAAAGELGPIEILVANAAHMSMGPFSAYREATREWWLNIDTNLTGTFHLVQAVLPGMRELGRGRIVILSSGWGITGEANATAYAASKAGLVSFGKGLARELAPERIVVNVVAPGAIDTPQLLVDAAHAGRPLEAVRTDYAAATPLGRLGHPEEVAATIAFLASPDAEAFVGQVVQPNGGTLR